MKLWYDESNSNNETLIFMLQRQDNQKQPTSPFLNKIIFICRMKNSRKLNRAQRFILIGILFILTVPYIEQLDGNASFDWGPFDFVLAFVILLTFGFGIEFLVRKIQSRRLKWLAILGIILFFVLLWGELAVGIFNSPIAGD